MRARISDIAPSGFFILRQDPLADSQEVLISDGLDTDELLDLPETALSQKLSEIVGIATLSKESARDLGLPSSAATLASLFHASQRLAGVFCHEATELSETDHRTLMACMIEVADTTPSSRDASIELRDLAYLRKAAAGFSDDEIAAELNLSMRSVKERKKRCIVDLGARNINHAMLIAKRQNLL